MDSSFVLLVVAILIGLAGSIAQALYGPAVNVWVPVIIVVMVVLAGLAIVLPLFARKRDE